MTKLLRCLSILALALTLGSVMAHAALAQESVQTLDPPAEGAAADPAIGEAPPPPPCGTQQLAIARMAWPSSALLAEVHSRLLTANYFCNVAVQEGDLAATGSSMGATGQPAVAPELWIGRIADIWNAAMKGQKVRQAGTPYADTTFEGWFVPEYAATQWPEVTTIDGLGIAPMSRTLVEKLLDTGELVEFPYEWKPSALIFTASYAHTPASFLLKRAAELAGERAARHHQAETRRLAEAAGRRLDQ